MSITNVSIGQLKEAIAIKKQIARLEQKLAKLTGGKVLPVAFIEAPAKKARKKRKMSAAGRTGIVAAQKARWAKQKGAAPVSSSNIPAKPAKKAKRVLSPEGRARIVAAMKKRWATKK